MTAFDKIRWIEAVIFSPLKDPATRLAIALASHRNSRTGACFPSHKRLAEMLHWGDPKKVQRTLPHLVEGGWVKVSNLKGGGRTQYDLLMDNVPSTDTPKEMDNIVQLRGSPKTPELGTNVHFQQKQPDKSVQLSPETGAKNWTKSPSEVDKIAPETGHQCPPNLYNNPDKNLNAHERVNAPVHARDLQLPPQFSGASLDLESRWTSVKETKSAAWRRWARRHYKQDLREIVPRVTTKDGMAWYRVPMETPPHHQDGIVRAKTAIKKVREYNEGLNAQSATAAHPNSLRKVDMTKYLAQARAAINAKQRGCGSFPSSGGAG